MSAMYAASSSQKTRFLSWRNPPTRSLSSRDVIAQPPPAGPRRSRTPFSSTELVLVRADVVSIARRQVVRVVLEVGREEPDRRQSLERVEQRRVPAGRRVDDVVVELDEVGRRGHAERLRVRVLPDVRSLWTTEIRGSSSESR